MKNCILILFALIPLILQAQQTSSEVEKEQVKKNLEWLANLNEKGLEMVGDSIKLGKDFRRLLTDTSYFNAMYPKDYSWEQTIEFFKKQELKEAFWYLINLYPENEKNKELVLKSVLTYDQVLKVDDLMVNSFNTFCYADPEISKIENERTEIVHPDIFETKLSVVQEIVAYVQHYRMLQNKE